jgi:predicted MPP superfamily phosphohydrolase
MLLLHISDIHFSHPLCDSDMDPERPYRTRLIQDARERVAKLGPVGAILVTGDIAFRGGPEEYKAAYTWLSELAIACDCPLERIFVVPGNHDVDRNIIRSSASVRNVQLAITIASQDQREKELLAQFRDTEAGRALLTPIGAYNDFAARFNCQVYTPDKLFWHQDLPLDNDTSLRLYGLTSTLLSGALGRDDTQKSLYLSPLQTALDPADGTINLVMCHHPPDWFMDQDAIEDAIRGRAVIHLFGHKHRQRVDGGLRYVHFSAGAVNPDRYESGWEPGYNLIKLSVAEEGGLRNLDIEAHLRVWQASPEMFRARMASETEPVFRYRLPIHGMLPSARPRPGSSPSVGKPDESSTPRAIYDVQDMEATMSSERTRNLVLRFWNLASSQRREIALELGLMEQDEMQLPEAERYGRALMRAGERRLLEKVAEAIEKREGANGG